MQKTGTKKGTTAKKKGRLNVGKLRADKETLKDLDAGAKKKIRGGGFGGGFTSFCVKKPES